MFKIALFSFQVQVLSQTSLKRRLETIQRIIKYLQSKTL
jgi:hypothetical protein